MKHTVSVLSLSSLMLLGCGAKPSQDSNTNTVDLPHTNVKWQSIGNCWAYSHLGWAESMLLKASGKTYNFSESYHTYRHFEDQIVNNRWTTEVNTGGNFYPSMRLIRNYGLIQEGDFIAAEADKTFSSTQSRAVSVLNDSLKNGALKDKRDAATVRKELNRAFGLSDEQFDAALTKVIRPETLQIGTTATGEAITLQTQIDSWQETSWSYDYLRAPREENKKAVVATELSNDRVNLLRRVFRAMNAGYPVIINWFVDFNAIDSKGILSAESINTFGWGRQGYHSTVLEDYTVNGVNPKDGSSFSTGEGDVSEELKTLAAEHGSLSSFIIKNSWGGADRFDRNSYDRFGEKGYHKLDASYALAWLPTHSETDLLTQTGYETAINSFVLPAGF